MATRNIVTEGTPVSPIEMNKRFAAVHVVGAGAHGVAGDGNTDDRDALHTLANVTIDSEGGTIEFLEGTYLISGNLTFPAHVALRMRPAVRLKPANGVTVTINGPLQAGLFQVFDTSAGGTIKFGSGAVERVYPQWWGVVPDGVTDYTATIQKMVNALGDGERLHLSRGEYRISNTITLPPTSCVLEFEQDAVVIQERDAPLFQLYGSYESGTLAIVAGADEGSDTITLDDASGLAVGDWLFLTSEDTITTSKAPFDGKYGMLRKIVSITGNNVKVDAALHRTLTTTPKARKVNLVKAPTIIGGVFRFDGAISGASGKTSPHFNFGLVEDPRFIGVTIRDGGGAGIQLAHCVGGSYTASRIENLTDEPEHSHWGYGVNLLGATRGFRFESGEVTHVRHAITTNRVLSSNALPALALYGEPEAIYYGPVYVYNTYGNALDTHEEGYGITIEANVHGAPLGVNVRCRGVRVSGQIVGARKIGILVSENATDCVIVAPQISHISDDGTGEGDGIAVADGAFAEIVHPMIVGFRRYGINVSGRANIVGGEVDGLDPSLNDYGILFQSTASGCRVYRTRVRNCAVGIREASGATDNEWHFVEFENNSANESVVPTYTKPKWTPHAESLFTNGIRFQQNGTHLTFENATGSNQYRVRTSGASNQNLQIDYWDGAAWQMALFIDPNGNVTISRAAVLSSALDHDGSTVGFYGATPTTKPTVTGSRDGNAALESLLTALATLGLVTDNSTAS